jgi:polyisoprenoid-binding protein YceI
MTVKNPNQQLNGTKRKERYMQLKPTLTSIAAALLLGSLAHAADTYKVDPLHTSVSFSVRHLGINNVKGKFKEFEGALVLESETLKEASGTI